MYNDVRSDLIIMKTVNKMFNMTYKNMLFAVTCSLKSSSVS